MLTTLDTHRSQRGYPCVYDMGIMRVPSGLATCVSDGFGIGPIWAVYGISTDVQHWPYMGPAWAADMCIAWVTYGSYVDLLYVLSVGPRKVACGLPTFIPSRGHMVSLWA